MANNWQSVDGSFPTFQEGESPYAQIQKLTDYMSSLTQMLKYSLSNLNADNWNSAGLKDFSTQLTGDIEKDLQAMRQQIKQLHSTVSGISSGVTGQAQQIKDLQDKLETMKDAFEQHVQRNAAVIAEYKQTLGNFETKIANIQEILSSICEWVLPDGSTLRIGYEGSVVQLQGDVYINGVKEE